MKTKTKTHMFTWKILNKIIPFLDPVKQNKVQNVMPNVLTGVLYHRGGDYKL